MKLSVRLSNVKQMKHVVARAIACSMLLVLPACLPALRNPVPAPAPPETFRGATSTDNTSQVKIEEFYTDPLLICLVHQAFSVEGNRELKILNEDVQVSRNEILARSGAYLPFLSLGANTGLNRFSRFTEQGASILDDPFLPGQHFTNPTGSYQLGANFTWQIDIYRQLRNARDAAAQRYIAASERRNYFATQLVAEIAENYYELVALDRRLENLDLTIQLQERSLEVARALLGQGRNTQLGVQRFLAEVRKNQSQKLIVNQDIIQVENRINFIINRYPQPVERVPAGFAEYFDLKIHDLSVGVPSQQLLNRPDIRGAERELVAAGLDVKVARANFYPQLVLNGGVGLESLVISHLFEPTAVAGNIASGLVAPFINRRALKGAYLSANARQLQALYNYQRVVLEAFTQVINQMTKVENYRRSVEVKKEQLEALVKSVEIASTLFQNARADMTYVDVLFAQRDMMDARRDLIDTKQEQLSAVVNTYQALGGGVPPIFMAETAKIIPAMPHHSGPPFPAGPQYPLPPPLPPLPPGPPGAVPPPHAWPLPEAGPPPQAGPANSPVQEKPPTDIMPLPPPAATNAR
jgi:outer membrane protein, multidrug efflux system